MKHFLLKLRRTDGKEIEEYCEQLRDILSVTQQDSHTISIGFLGGMVFKNSQEITIYLSQRSISSTFSIVYRFASKKVHGAPYDLLTLDSLLSVIKKAVKKAKRMTGYKGLYSFYRPEYSTP